MKLVASRHKITGNPLMGQGGRQIVKDMEAIFGGKSVFGVDHLKPYLSLHGPVHADATGWFPSTAYVQQLVLPPAETARTIAALEVYKAKRGTAFAGHVALEAAGTHYTTVLDRPKRIVLRSLDNIISEEVVIDAINRQSGDKRTSDRALARAKALYENFHYGNLPTILAAPSTFAITERTTFFAEGGDYRRAIGNMAHGLGELELLNTTTENSFPTVFGYKNMEAFDQRWENAMPASTPLAAAELMLRTTTESR